MGGDGKRSHHLLLGADVVPWERKESRVKSDNKKKKIPQSGQYDHVVKNLIQTTLGVHILINATPQKPKEDGFLLKQIIQLLLKDCM